MKTTVLHLGFKENKSRKFERFQFSGSLQRTPPFSHGKCFLPFSMRPSSKFPLPNPQQPRGPQVGSGGYWVGEKRRLGSAKKTEGKQFSVRKMAANMG